MIINIFSQLHSESLGSQEWSFYSCQDHLDSLYLKEGKPYPHTMHLRNIVDVPNIIHEISGIPLVQKDITRSTGGFYHNVKTSELVRNGGLFCYLFVFYHTEVWRKKQNRFSATKHHKELYQHRSWKTQKLTKQQHNNIKFKKVKN